MNDDIINQILTKDIINFKKLYKLSSKDLILNTNILHKSILNDFSECVEYYFSIDPDLKLVDKNQVLNSITFSYNSKIISLFNDAIKRGIFNKEQIKFLIYKLIKVNSLDVLESLDSKFLHLESTDDYLYTSLLEYKIKFVNFFIKHGSIIRFKELQLLIENNDLELFKCLIRNKNCMYIENYLQLLKLLQPYQNNFYNYMINYSIIENILKKEISEKDLIISIKNNIDFYPKIIDYLDIEILKQIKHPLIKLNEYGLF